MRMLRRVASFDLLARRHLGLSVSSDLLGESLCSNRKPAMLVSLNG